MSAKERVLVVDDSPQNRLVASGHLEAAGYDVVTASSGEEALELLGRESIDLVVLDVLMPGLGGFETCRRIRTTPAIAQVPVLFLTALGDREATTPALEAGGDDLLSKPFNRAELMLRARALIRQRQTTQRLQQAMQELTEQNEQLRRVEHDKRRMSQLIVHDLKGPIGAVLANAQLMRRQATGTLAEVFDDIILAAEQIDRTARDLLDLSQAEEGALDPQLETFSLSALIDEVASSMRGLARWTDVTIETDVGPEDVTADRELLRRLLQNLVHNAVKHAPRRTAVSIEATIEGGDILLRVVDRGPGIPADATERIFDSGVRLPRESGRAAGHGLGLAFCRLAAEAHGGKIWVEHRDQPGATFVVRIPQAPVPSPA